MLTIKKKEIKLQLDLAATWQPLLALMLKGPGRNQEFNRTKLTSVY